MAKKGAPLGNKNAVHARPWTDALRKELIDPDGKRLRAIAARVCKMAEDGDIQAIREISDRLDGKPVQAIVAEHSGDITIVHRLEG